VRRHGRRHWPPAACPASWCPTRGWPWASWRGLAPALCLPLIAVTGSNGKTTVTQMIAAILRAWQGDAALATAGNFNNDIGLPLTCCACARRTAWRWSSWA
jgi:UDP-N-acetylmuramyl pentapeptide synthase